jgi:hypothetical protein
MSMHPIFLIALAIWLIAITPKPRPFTARLQPIQKRDGATIINRSAFQK